jgi:hypothetical protein
MARDGIENTTQVWGRAAASVRARVGPGMGRRRAARTLGLRLTGTGAGCGRHHGWWGARRAGGIGATALRAGSGRRGRRASRTFAVWCVRIDWAAVRYRLGRLPALG